jgi:hypothetical protein
VRSSHGRNVFTYSSGAPADSNTVIEHGVGEVRFKQLWKNIKPSDVMTEGISERHDGGDGIGGSTNAVPAFAYLSGQSGACSIIKRL